MSEFLSFHLSDDFLKKYEKMEPEWGFDIGGGNSLSELTFIAKYSRKKEDGSKERWYEVCQRCIEGMYSILKDHAKYQRTPWNEFKAQKSAQDAYERMFHFKWTPPGRGLQHMGTEYIHTNRNGSRLINCSAISTEKISTHSAYEATMPFVRLMEMSMSGIGVGVDCRGAGRITLHQPSDETEIFVVPDTREGWAASLGKLLESFFFKNRKTVKFDYSEVRPEGAPLKSFSGTASGPDPLRRMHEQISELLSNREGELLTSRDIVDITNLTGKATVAGGSRRSALISFGEIDDEDYVNLKNWELEENAKRTGMDGWAWASNNSVLANSGDDLSSIIDKIAINGEPGILWVDLMRKYGRLEDVPNDRDYRTGLTNPCLSGDTLIAVADGRGAVPIRELAESGDDVPVYSMDPRTGMVEIKWGRHPRLTRSQTQVLEIKFNDGSSLRVTPDHEFLLMDGSIKKAHELLPKDSIPAFTKSQAPTVKNGPLYWQMVCSTDGKANPKRVFEHRMIAQFFEPELWDYKYDNEKLSGWQRGGLVVHHRDYDPLNNSPDNLEIMSFRDHAEFHGKNDFSGEKNPMYGREQSNETKELIGSKCRERWSDPEYYAKMGPAIAAGMTDESRQKISDARKKSLKEYYLEQEAKTDLSTIWIDDRLYAVKSCEGCGSEIVLAWKERERAFCSQGCVDIYYHSKYGGSRRDGDPDFGSLMASSQVRKDNQRAAFRDRATNTRQQQIDTYLSLQVELGRDPMKKEWENRCRENGIPVRFQAAGKTSNPNILRGYKHLKEEAMTVNHRVVSVTYLDAPEDVYNITVDDHHTMGIITRIAKKGLHGIYASNCGEIGLEGGGELCNLSELYPMNHDSIEDFKRTIKHAYMYCKAVTLLPTPWMETNEIIIRNRRIGVSMTGIAEFVETRGWSEIKDWMDVGYRHLVELDKSYSEWLGVRESIKLSTVKPAGSTSLLAATTSGVHWPTTSGHFIRRIRFSKVDPLVDLLAAAGYRIEDDRNDPKTTVVAEFPTTGVKVRSERDVSVWEKAQLAALAQRYWSDNLVSCTLSFTKAEQDSLGPLLASMDGQLKSASFLPIDESGTTYEQAPYEPLDSDVAVQMQKKIKPLNTAKLYASGIDAKDEKFCNTDSCEISFG